MVLVFARPLLQVLQQKQLSPQLFYTEVSDGFMVVFRISLICAAAISAPWMAYQIWQFVAAGLYPHERKYVTKYIPLSLTLLIAGMLFVYFVVLPWTLDFFISFGDSIPLQYSSTQIDPAPPKVGFPQFPHAQRRPAAPRAGAGVVQQNPKAG